MILTVICFGSLLALEWYGEAKTDSISRTPRGAGTLTAKAIRTPFPEIVQHQFQQILESAISEVTGEKIPKAVKHANSIVAVAPTSSPFAADLPAPVPILKKVPMDMIPMPARVREQIKRELGGGALPPPSGAGGGGGGATGAKSSGTNSAAQASLNRNETEGPREFSYRVHAFSPGQTKSHVPIQEVPSDLSVLNAAVVGPPDFSLDSKTPARSKLLSLGNGGSIVLEVIDGYIVDQDGPDFVVFENPFVIAGTGGAEVYAETAVVSVAEQDDASSYRSFPCNAGVPPYAGCAGVVPVRYASNIPIDQIGGDLFDLATIGVSRIRYIKIQDTGDNESFLEGTEGFDMDAMGLIHTSF